MRKGASRCRERRLNKTRQLFKPGVTKGPFIATQLNSTQLDVELSCVGGSL